MNPEELVASGKPYVRYDDQFIETERWADPKCSCKGVGTFGMQAPHGKAEKQIKLGGNLPCLCGSGIKYKKCCRDRVERLAKGGYRILICGCVGGAFLAENPFVEEMRKELAAQWKITPPAQDNQATSPSGPPFPSTSENISILSESSRLASEKPLT